MKETKLIDLDATLTDTKEADNYDLSHAPVIKKNLDLLNHFFYKGNRIVIYTARDWWDYDNIEKWLKKHHIPFHSIICGKPAGEIWDDRARNINCKECLVHARTI